MSSVTTSVIASGSFASTLVVATTLGRKLKGGEVIELVGDLGAGKTVFVRGLAEGIDSRDQVQSPSFTISRIYRGKDMEIHHFDFHRLEEPGVLAEQLQESFAQPNAVTVIEWSGIVKNLLPPQRLSIGFKITGENARQLTLRATGKRYQELVGGLG